MEQSVDTKPYLRTVRRRRQRNAAANRPKQRQSLSLSHIPVTYHCLRSLHIRGRRRRRRRRRHRFR